MLSKEFSGDFIFKLFVIKLLTHLTQIVIVTCGNQTGLVIQAETISPTYRERLQRQIVHYIETRDQML